MIYSQVILKLAEVNFSVCKSEFESVYKMNAVPVGPRPFPIPCPYCKATVVTSVERKTTIRTHLMAALLCSCLCGLLCTCIPYCMNSCRNADHYCPNCGAYLGTYKH